MQESTYTPISTAAVACAGCAALTAGGFLFPVLAFAAIPTIIFGLLALRDTREYGLVGRRLAIVGLPLSLTIAVGTFFLEGTLYRSEALPGYKRLSFAEDLDGFAGQQVCLKGYSWGTETREVSSFAFSPTGSSHRGAFYVLVELADGNVWEWDGSGIAVSGRLERLPVREDDPNGSRYILKDAIVRPSRTAYQIAQYAGGGC